jgi:hypothetical protein
LIHEKQLIKQRRIRNEDLMADYQASYQPYQGTFHVDSSTNQAPHAQPQAPSSMLQLRTRTDTLAATTQRDVPTRQD